MKNKFLLLIAIISVIVITIIGLKNNLSSEITILFSTIVCVTIALIQKIKIEDILKLTSAKISDTFQALLILVLIGMLIGTWIYSGTIPMMIYTGLNIINVNYIITTMFFIMSLSSLCTGTSWGSIGTIGVALIGVAETLNVNLSIAAGAIISGAYFGDKLSPLSDSTNLCPLVSGTTIYKHISKLLWTTLPSFIIAGIIYLLIDFNSTKNISEITQSKEAIELLKYNFEFNIFVMIPIIIMLLGCIMKKNTIVVIILSSISALIIGYKIQNFDLSIGFNSILNGFDVTILKKTNFLLSKLFSRGGLNSMMNTILIAFFVFTLASSIELIGCFDIIKEFCYKQKFNYKKIVLFTIVICLLTIMITSNGVLSILLCGNIFKEIYKQNNIEQTILSRTLEDTITITENLMPWTLAGIYVSTTLNVPTLNYAPFAFFNYFGIIFATFYALTGISIKKE